MELNFKNEFERKRKLFLKTKLNLLKVGDLVEHYTHDLGIGVIRSIDKKKKRVNVFFLNFPDMNLPMSLYSLVRVKQ